MVAIALAGALVAILASSLIGGGGSEDPLGSPAPPTTTTAEVGPAEVYRAILPSLVFISTDRADPEPAGIGSGVVVDDEGRIMTAHHVVRDATRIEVQFADGTVSPARVVNADPANDIAVLESDRSPQVIVPAVLGGGVRVGDPAYPVGNPLGYSGSLTAGVVSGLGRSITREDGAGTLGGLIQFDAAVNPGSSGGPLLNRAGQVVGIVTALANPTEHRTFIGLGFAVPIATASAAAGSIDR